MDAIAQLKTSLAGRYAVDKEIGRGGMATVYLARDVRHNRKVALKVLNPELGAVLGVERFLSEIQVTANLQHPNLLPLFDSGEAEGLLFYVMPYVEGESLRAKLQREKQLPIDEAVQVAISVASALDYAHRHGVIHRDLKPENILMHEGQPLVADFGIALAVSNAGGNRITQTGLSLGTPHYMSPEQATGDREVDGRTDIYSLGAVTYEMLVGEPPHDGKTSQAIIAKVLTDKPRSIRLSRDTVPAHVEAAVDRALAKLPADRYHTAHEFADGLSGKAVVLPSGVSTPATIMRDSAPQTRADRMRAMLPWAVAATALAIAAVGWGKAINIQGASSRVLRYEVPLPPKTTLTVGRGNPVAISRDARFIAYVASSNDGPQRLYLRAADELQPREVTGSDGAVLPIFSPAGDWIAFWSEGTLKKAPVSGGTPLVVTEQAGSVASAWSESGWFVTGGGGLARAPATGGELTSFMRRDTARGETNALNPVILADGKTVLYTSLRMGGLPAARIGITTMDGAGSILDLPGGVPLGMVDHNLVYATASGTLMAAPVDLGKRRVTGPPVALVDQATVELNSYQVYARMSADGSLIYVSGVPRRQLTMINPDGSTRELGEPGAYSQPRISPDGRRIALTVGSTARRDVWVYDIPTGSFARLTTEGTINDRPEWTPDGRNVVFRTNRGARNELWVQSLDGGEATKLFGIADSHVDEGVLSPDGSHLVIQRDRTANGEMWFRAMRGDTTLRGGEQAYGARFSPDGKWVAFTTGAAGNQQIYVRPYPSLTPRYQVSLAGGGTPVWSADSKRIYYTNAGQLMAAAIGSTQPFAVASRSVVLSRGYTFNGVHADYDVGRDGRIFALRSPTDDAQIVVVRHFDADLRARLSGAPK